MNSLRNYHALLQLATTELISQQPSSSKLHRRAYSSTRAQLQPSSRKKTISPSFKPGPFKGALLSETPASDDSGCPSRGPEHPPRARSPIAVKHDYSASQLARSLRQNSPHSASKLHFPHSKLILEHLHDLLHPLVFSDQVACRIVSSKNLVKSQDSLDALNSQTPGGVGFAIVGEHNAKFSFIGRRMMHFALSDFLLHAPTIKTHKKKLSGISQGRLTSEVIEEALLTKFVLGQFVGQRWELEKIMRWRELSAPPESSELKDTRSQTPVSTGLWTARGYVVEAILGAVMTQYGTRLSNAIFNSLVLPHLSFRLDPSYIPAIKAVQAHDRELESPKAGLIDWNQLDIEPFITDENTLDDRQPVQIAAVG